MRDIVYYYEEGVLRTMELLSIEDTGEYVEMYNVEYVKKNNTFFANKILVHNKYLAKKKDD